MSINSFTLLVCTADQVSDSDSDSEVYCR